MNQFAVFRAETSSRTWALGAAIIFSALCLAAWTGSHVVWSMIFGGLLALLAWTDLRTETVPDGLTIALVLTGMSYTISVGSPVLGPVAGIAILLTLGLLQERYSPDKGWFGSGDFFLASGILAWLGNSGALETVLFASFFICLHAILQRRTSIALAPSLSAAALLHWLGGPIL